MKPPTPTMARWGRGLQVLAGLALQAAPFLPFAVVPLPWFSVPVPGVFLHGSSLLAFGVLALVAALLRAPRPGLQALLAVASAGLATWDLSLVLQRTDYVLGRLQLSLVGLNHLVQKLGMDALELYHRDTNPWDYVGVGVWLALGAAALLLLGAVLEVLGLASSGKAPWSVLLGYPRCRACGQGVRFEMAFCPGCGRIQGPGRPCPACGQRLEEGHRFCASCGAPAADA